METGRPLATLIIVPLVLCLLTGPRGGRVDTGDAVYILAGARGFLAGAATASQVLASVWGCRRSAASEKVRGLSPAAGEA